NSTGPYWDGLRTYMTQQAIYPARQAAQRVPTLTVSIAIEKISLLAGMDAASMPTPTATPITTRNPIWLKTYPASDLPRAPTASRRANTLSFCTARMRKKKATTTTTMAKVIPVISVKDWVIDEAPGVASAACAGVSASRWSRSAMAAATPPASPSTLTPTMFTGVIGAPGYSEAKTSSKVSNGT